MARTRAGGGRRGRVLAIAAPLSGGIAHDASACAQIAESIDAHRPAGNYWYLHFVGVRGEHQGKGHGGRIIRAQTVVADTEGLPCWLETATPDNVPLYQRLGFVTQAEWDVPGRGPHFWGMMRPALNG
ncbi:MAG: GNAT family N-acetyltransferase [Sphingopyxis sp.]|nr:GNAT family N-acetyltransferase [Sphingopyxis sp.]